jgi:C-terminal processing protease CtpA/Prc
VTIDFPNERLYLAKGKHFADPDRGRTCGIGLLSKQGRLEVVHGRLEVVSVDERGPAYAAGLRAKDLIVELCGKPVSAWKQSEVDRLFKTEGKAVQMTIERDGKRIEKSFTPKEYD